MKRLIWGTAILFVVSATSAYADSIPILNINITLATFSMGPNDGSGDNVSFTLIGPGTNITGFGGMACFEWCLGASGDPIPDLSSVSISQVFVGGFGSAIIGGTTDDPQDLSLCCFFSSGDLNGSVSGFVGEGPTFTQLKLWLPTAHLGVSWGLTFNFIPAEGDSPAGYQFVHGEFIAATPEPGTIGFMATGLAGIIGVIRRHVLHRPR